MHLVMQEPERGSSRLETPELIPSYGPMRGRSFKDVGKRNRDCDSGLARGVENVYKETFALLHAVDIGRFGRIRHLVKTPSGLCAIVSKLTVHFGD